MTKQEKIEYVMLMTGCTRKVAEAELMCQGWFAIIAIEALNDNQSGEQYHE